MEKKTLKNKKPKFTVVMFYGPIAAGKFTVAEEFKRQTGFKFFHNHHTADIVRELFGNGSSGGLTEKLRFEVFQAIARARLNVVATHAYSADYISSQGISDPQFVKRLQSIVEKTGGRMYFIHLVPSEAELLRRVKGESRKRFRKVKTTKLQKELLAKHDFVTSAPVRYNLEIDNSNLSPKKVVKKVLEYIATKN